MASSSSNNEEVVYGADELLEAALEGRAEDAVEILTKDPTLTRIGDAVGDSAFHVAARAGHDTTISKMNNHLKIMIDTLCKGNTKVDTPLHLALSQASPFIRASARMERVDRPNRMGLLTKDPTLIRIGDAVGDSAFHVAARAGHDTTISNDDDDELEVDDDDEAVALDPEIEISIVKKDLSDDDDDEEDEPEWIRLFEAASRGELNTIEKIMEEDVHQDIIKYKDKIDCNAIHKAAYHGQDKALEKIAELMHSESDFKMMLLESDRYGNTPLYYAVDGGHKRTAIYLVKEAPRATYKANNKGDSPLCLAVQKGYSDLVSRMMTGLQRSIRSRLLEHAKKVSIAHIALEKRNLAVFKAIMDGLPELIDSWNNKGWRPLSFGAFNGYYDEICYIVENHQKYIAKKDKDGTYPIHKAITGGHVNVAEKLISCYPDILNYIDKKGNLLEFATYYRKNDVVSYLKGLNHFR